MSNRLVGIELDVAPIQFLDDLQEACPLIELSDTVKLRSHSIYRRSKS